MPPGLEIDVAEWEGAGFDWDAFDERMEQLAASTAQGPFVLRLGLAAGAGEGEAAARLARAGLEALNRCQRFMPRRNQASSHPAFDRLLARHRLLHDLTQRRVRAAYARALDTWQWLLRLDPTADEAVQIAALLLGAERLAPPPGRPVWAARERAGDRRFADLGARRGAMVGDELLADCGIDLVTRVRVSLLIGARERRPAWGEVESWNRALLDDADALSLLCLWSPGAPGNHLSARTPRAFVSATLGCLRHESRGWLDQVRLHPAIAGAVAMERENPATPSAREAQLATVRAPLPRLVPVRRTPASDRPIPMS